MLTETYLVAFQSQDVIRLSDRMIIIYSTHSVYSGLLHTSNKTKSGCASLCILLFKRRLKSSLVWLEGIEYIISKIPGSDNYENYPNIPNIDGQPRYQTSPRRSTDIFRGEKAINCTGAFYRSDHQRSSRVTKAHLDHGCFTRETQYHFKFAFLLTG